MFNNNINKPAITVFLPLTSAKTSFCQWQKLVFAGKNYFCRDGFFSAEKTGFYRSLAKTCQPWRQSTEGKSNCCRHTKNKNKDNTVENDAMMYNDVDNTLKLSTESPRANFELLEIYRGEMLLVINIT